MNEMAGSNLGYTNQTILHPLALAALLILGTAMLLMPRRWAFVPMLIMASFVSTAQRITIASIDFDLLRIMVIFALIRVFVRRETHLQWNLLDRLIILWAVCGTVVFFLNEGSISALVNRLGSSFDILGMYFVFRMFIRDWADIDSVVLGVILVSIPVSVAFLIERTTGRNIFSVFGGVPEFTVIRDGKLRCQGAFSHAIVAGCFWASMMPLTVAFWWRGIVWKKWALLGVITYSVVIICCASSTPVMAVFCMIIGGGVFYFRYHMQYVRWGALLVLVFLHMVMEAPVWHLISRVSAVGGSTGWHRYHLIDKAIANFGEWCFLGVRSTAHWGNGLEDVTNQYILEGVRGGFLTLCIFITIIVYGFRYIGKLWRASSNSTPRLAMSWALGVSLFVHCMNFLGISYFGQINMIWYLLLAMIGSLAPMAVKSVEIKSKRI